MGYLTRVNQLVYKNNAFGEKSLQALIPIICKSKSPLRTLQLIHCKMTAQTTHDLLHSLNQQRNQIRSLSLVNVNLNQYNYKELC